MQGLFVQVPTELMMNPEVPRSAVLLAAALIDLQDGHGCVVRTVDQLASYTQLSERTVRRAERALCELGVITITHAPSGRESQIWIADKYRSGRKYSAIINQLEINRKEVI